MIAFCVLVCDNCPVFLATFENDEFLKKAMRRSIAEECNINYGLNLLPEDVNDCEGCKSTNGRIFSGCSNCEIRKCAVAKNIENCAFCEDYICSRLKELYSLDPKAQYRAEEIRNKN